jgi:hypothetical protein
MKTTLFAAIAAASLVAAAPAAFAGSEGYFYGPSRQIVAAPATMDVGSEGYAVANGPATAVTSATALNDTGSAGTPEFAGLAGTFGGPATAVAQQPVRNIRG